jgi:hypothetical protein
MSLSEEEERSILEKLDSLIDDVRDVKASHRLIEANSTFLAGEMARIAKCFSDHEQRIVALEEAARSNVPHAPRIASFTNEAVTNAIGESIRSAAMAHTEPLKESIEKNEKRSFLIEVVKAIVLALILALSVFVGRH